MRRTLIRLAGFSGSTLFAGTAVWWNFTSLPEDAATGSTDAGTYYISASGDDTDDGLSQATAWETVAPLMGLDLEPGAEVLLEGGSRFDGTIRFDEADGGDPDDPIVLSSYGDDPATLDAGQGTGIVAHNAAGIEISDLLIEGSGIDSNTGWGIHVFTDLPDEGRLDYVVIDDVEVSGFTEGGIVIEGQNGKDFARGFRDVAISSSTVYDNGDVGIATLGYWEADTPQDGYAHEDVRIEHNTVHGNVGRPGKTDLHTGNGIMMSSVDGGVIEHNEAYENGAGNVNDVGGPVGIWAWDSNEVAIQFNASHDNRTGSTADGAGFDLDGGVTNSVMQYNYSRGNDGAGYLVAQFGGSRPLRGNVVRYNISEDDGRANGYGAITVFAQEGEWIGDLDIHNNTVFVSDAAAEPPSAVKFLPGRYAGIDLRNNVFVTSGDARLVDAPAVKGVRFENNAYWDEDGSWAIEWGDSTYERLTAWRDGTQQEVVSGEPVGVDTDPQLTDPGGGGDIERLSELDAYRPLPESPLVDAGLPPDGTPAVARGERDFSGDPVPIGAGPDIGAYES